MKRMFTVLFAALLVTAALCVGASASDFDAAAKELSAIGMFRGDGTGFALDRTPTRSEAAIMLVRLYGAEEKAKTQYDAGEISHPFTDVSDTAAPYVAWLRTSGIANGTSETTFGSAQPCTVRNYVVFLLRALGYQDGEDFQYDGALDFGMTKGLFDTSMFSGTFLRDDLAAVTYQALACDLKDGSTYLLDSLIKSGAIDKEAAAPITGKIETYRTLLKASANIGTALDVDLTGKAQMDMTTTGTAGGETLDEHASIPVSFTGKVQIILAEQPQMAVTMQGKALEEQMDTGVWLKDGWMYMRQGEASYKTETGSFLEQLQALQNLSAANQTNTAMLPYFDTITSAASGSDTVYTMKLNSAASSFLDDVMSLISSSALTGETALDGLDLRLSDASFTYTLAPDGSMKGFTAAMKLGMDVSTAEDPQNTMQVKVDMDMSMDMTVNAFGEAVKVEFPADLSSFPERIGGADAAV